MSIHTTRDLAKEILHTLEAQKAAGESLAAQEDYLESKLAVLLVSAREKGYSDGELNAYHIPRIDPI